MADIEGNKTGGRKKGVPNKDNELKAFIKSLITDNRVKLTEEIKELTGKPYVDAVMALMEYSVPKLSRTEVIAEIEVTDSVDLSNYKVEDLKKSIESNKTTD